MVGAGGASSCAVLSSGGIKCWNRTAPFVVLPVPDITDAVAVAVGDSHTCALLAAGAIRCWGANDYGQLGNGTTTDSSATVAVVGF